MFTTIDTSGIRISALDLADDRLAVVRERGRDGELRCQHCAQPAILRAGKVVRWHFSHAPGAQCPFAHEPVERLQARAVLYGWLAAQFGPRVTVEKMPDGLPAPHPVDGWVDMEDGRKFAYFVVDRRLDREHREKMHWLYHSADVSLHWVFLARWMRRPDGIERDRLRLSGTESDCKAASDYNTPYAAHTGAGYRTLHYIDARTRHLTTFRALRPFDCTRGYVGTEVRTEIASVSAEPATGEFVHPGEAERLAGFVQARQFAEAERQRQRDLLWQRADEDARERERLQAEGTHRGVHNSTGVPDTVPSSPDVPGIGNGKWEAACVFCRAVTRNWYRSSVGTGSCVCLTCRRGGVDDDRQI